MTKEQKYFEEIVHQTTDADLGQMFGKACGKINNKAFVAFFQNEMVFKIGQEEVRLMLNKYPGSQNWDPSGKKRPMKDWIQVPAEYTFDWKSLADKAVDFYKTWQ